MKKRMAFILIVVIIMGIMNPFGITTYGASFSPRLSLPSDARTTIKEYMVNSSPGWGNYNPYSAFSVGNCTWYAFGRAWEILGYFPGDLVFPGDAEVWFNENKAKYDSGKGGFPYSTDRNAPALGAIAVWENTSNAYGEGGHVAVVEQISDNSNGTKTIVTSESAYSSYYFQTITRSTESAGLGWSGKWSFLGYIYLLDHPQLVPDALLNPVVFNLDYYKSSYTDLQEAFGNDDAAYINHWITDGAVHGRCASPCFYSAWYLNYYSDVEGAVGVGNYIGAIEHFVNCGIVEGRMGSSEFYVGVYRENFLDLQQAFGNDNYSYFIHYINSGQKEGRLANERMKAFFDPNGGSCSVESMPITSVANYGTLPIATKAGCAFLGWYTSREGGEHITADSQVRVVTHQTLYAHWANDCGNGHNYTYRVTTTPTTSASGTLTGTCSRCGATTTVTLPKLNATDYTYSITKTATCSATGTGRYTWKTTTYGTFYFDVTLEKSPHTYAATLTAPTCTEKGFTTHTCSGCGDSYVDTYTDALGHDWDDGIVTTQPTETKEGVKTFTCTRCGATRTESVPALGHTHSYTATVMPPTCTGKGYTTYTCACGDSYVADYVGALGHNFVGGICTRCGEDDPNYNPPTPKDPCKGYTDINRGSWYHSAADFVISRGLMGSTKTDALTFEPNTKVSRAMVASILYRMAGSPAVEYKATFTDVPADKWFTSAIEWCAQNGLASGKGNGKFDPNGNVTRQELAVFMMKMAEYLGKDTSGRADLGIFADAAKVPAWAKTYLEWAVDAGLISGKANGGKTYLAPTDNATRAEFASIEMRFCDKFIY